MVQGHTDETQAGVAGRAPFHQAADAVLMVRPAAFGWNRETAGSNAFQRQGGGAPSESNSSVILRPGN